MERIEECAISHERCAISQMGVRFRTFSPHHPLKAQQPEGVVFLGEIMKMKFVFR